MPAPGPGQSRPISPHAGGMGWESPGVLEGTTESNPAGGVTGGAGPPATRCCDRERGGGDRRIVGAVPVAAPPARGSRCPLFPHPESPATDQPPVTEPERFCTDRLRAPAAPCPPSPRRARHRVLVIHRPRWPGQMPVPSSRTVHRAWTPRARPCSERARPFTEPRLYPRPGTGPAPSPGHASSSVLTLHRAWLHPQPGPGCAPSPGHTPSHVPTVLQEPVPHRARPRPCTEPGFPPARSRSCTEPQDCTGPGAAPCSEPGSSPSPVPLLPQAPVTPGPVPAGPHRRCR